ncbi:MAG TPA: ribosome-associated translation inhibitor RaiA [Acidobacteriaceae bacterium]|nr:ribosome-associated translation inhibitor RaiA [Acidobacteriaceae bacterium]
MIVEYTGRQFVVTQKYRQQAEAGLKAIQKIVSTATSAKVILTVDKYRKIAEVTVTERGQSLVARCEAADMMTALHDALAKIEQQAVRQKQKATTTKRHPRTADRAAFTESVAASA